MSAQNQCCTADQAERLHKLGLSASTLFTFQKCPTHYEEWKFYAAGLSHCSTVIQAFNVAEMGAMLQKETRDIYYHNPSGMWSHHNTTWDKNNPCDLFATQAQCYADRLLYLMTTYPVKYSAEFMIQRLAKFNNYTPLS